MGAIEELQRDCAYCRQPICQCPQKACAWSLIRSSRTDAGRSSGPTTTGSERSHEALELRRKPQDARPAAGAKARRRLSCRTRPGALAPRDWP
jgi:hypothetical protein